ncbi:MAG: hypothetical protein AAGJ18_22185, partial [Bacteroidota bacterium]
EVHLHGLGYWHFLTKNELRIDAVTLDSLSIKITPRDSSTAPDTTSDKSDPKRFEIRNLLVKKGQFSLENEELATLQIDSFQLKVADFIFDPHRDSTQIDWGASTFSGYNFRLDQRSAQNRLLAERLELTDNDQLTITNFHYQPKRSKANYLQYLPHRKARLDAQLTKIRVQKLALKPLIFNQSFKAETIRVNGALEVYSDKNKAACSNCLKPYPYEDWQTSDWQIAIDSILITDSQIVYEELRQGEEETGQLDWEQVYGSIYHLNNQVALQQPYTLADIQAKFLKEGTVNIHFEFPNYAKNNDYHFNGSIDQLSLKKINRFLVFSKQFRIQRGRVNHFAFSGKGNLQTASGDMEMRYEKLKIQLIKKDRTPRKFLSKVANLVFGKSNNPDKNDELRLGKMYFERDPQKSFIGNWWKTIQSGLKSIMLPNILLPDELEHAKKE